MTFRPDGPFGEAILVPCLAEIETIDDLMAEAGALWKAEAPKAATGTIGSNWGCVGALFGNGNARASMAADWCVFRGHPAGDSDNIRPPIPI